MNRVTGRLEDTLETALKSNPVVEDELDLDSGQSRLMSVFWWRHQKKDGGFGWVTGAGVVCASDAFTEVFVVSVACCGSHAVSTL